MEEKKEMFRSTTDKKIGGVCGGLAVYFGIDPTILRVIWALLILVGTLGFWAYIVCWIVLPKKNNGLEMIETKKENSALEKKEIDETNQVSGVVQRTVVEVAVAVHTEIDSVEQQ